MRRQLVHGENIPPIPIAAMSIQIITSNIIKVLKKNPGTKEK
jgi:hypothetical protein